MDNNSISVSEAELTIMKTLWAVDEPLTAQDIAAALTEKSWKYSTIATLLGRMVEKGAVTYEKRGRFFYYTALISEKSYKLAQTENFIARLYNGSVKNLVASLFENKALSENDISEIKKLFDLEE